MSPPAERSDPPYLPLARRVKAARERLRLTQREIAPAAHITPSYWGNLEQGVVRPRPDVLRRIARALDVDYETLAAEAGYIDRPSGDVTLEVPADAAARVRWYAALPARLQELARRLLDAATEEMPDVGQQEAGDEPEAATRE